jgi:tetratricopeptide (TPR) repeat protein
MPEKVSLRLTRLSLGSSELVEIAVEEPGQPRKAVSVPFAWAPSDLDQERLRWYFEDYLQFPADPAPALAAGVEQRMAELGKELFSCVFCNEDARELWSGVRGRLGSAHVEVLSDEAGARSHIPWELLWDPRTNVPIAIRAASFTRGYANPLQSPRPLAGGGEQGQIRILLAICRPARDDDVPFRSVAGRLLKGLGERQSTNVRLDVLRPPTFARMTELLRIAAEDQPYHIVHFDGHGAFRREGGRPGSGCLVFEDDEAEDGIALVDGSQMGNVLAETGVPFLILNACRSASPEPGMAPGGDTEDAHARVRAYGSLALEAMDAGVTGVVAMQYNVYVNTAARFVGDLYATLARGQTLGRAVSLGRKQLHEHPSREPGELGIELRDWPVPIVYEAAPVSIFPLVEQDSFAVLEFDETRTAPVRGLIDPDLPPAPDAGFYGRDDTLLAIDRAFDSERVVLLHAYAGSGKTATAAEFARWYSLTGGNDGPVLFTSFERYTPLARVLDDFATVFAPWLERSNIAWLSLTDVKRRQLTLSALSQVPVLWVWDNVEPIAGFPSGTESAWTPEEQNELISFLRDLRATQARVLITSRREEREWLGELPVRITMPGMPAQERVQLARALAQRLGSPIRRLDVWRPLLRYTRGNPLTIQVVVGEAIRQGLTETDQFEAFVAELVGGEAEMQDDEQQGRSMSLGASLSYGFREAFDDQDRERLALLHLFDGEVADFLLASLGHVGEHSLPALVDWETADARRLLDRAAEIGHLTVIGPGVYTIHPALPAYFNDLYTECHANDGDRALRSYCETFAHFAQHFSKSGRTHVEIGLLQLFESNLLQARRQCRHRGWRRTEIEIMDGLHAIYELEGRWTAWARLLEGTAVGIVDPESGAAIVGLEEEWDQVTQWRVRLAFARNDGALAASLQGLLVGTRVPDAERAQAEGADDGKARLLYRNAAVALSEFGQALGLSEDEQTISIATRALHFADLSHDRDIEAMLAYNLAAITLRLRGIESWERCRELLERARGTFKPEDHLAQSRCYSELGFIALERGRATEDEDEKRRLAFEAIEDYERALALTPANAKESLAMKHMNLGIIYIEVGKGEMARGHLDAAVMLAEQTAQTQIAARARSRIAMQLAAAGDHEAAALFARRALNDLKPVDGASTRIIAEINGLLDYLAAKGVDT